MLAGYLVGNKGRWRQKHEVHKIHSSALSPYNAKDREQAHQAGLLASGSKCFSSTTGQWLLLSLRGDEMLTSYSSATASDSHRLPYSTETSCQGHLVKTLCIVTSLSILIGFPHCQRIYSVREEILFTLDLSDKLKP
jgi:hypothetical protein